MGNRGSKSAICESIAVKEQRVDGKKSHLRCTLLGFERSYLVKIPSNQIIKKQFYYTAIANYLNIFDFISGFTDAEVCFLIIIRKTGKTYLDILILIKTYFGVGRIIKERNGCCDFLISSLDQIRTKVIPHFYKYLLKIAFMIQHKEHLTAEGLQKIAFPNYVALERPLLPPLRAKLDPQ
ncbi:putative 49.1 kDa protein in ND3 intron [Golovinomyces cichoracearum]|uniref:Putative 49.1 kDa protein in ND3 intron n=1 Tax=Golovinomyces cichoracearum TaxID=62708 RepID=A0A420I518_9PEZI|nr:putative 49.1 kDa protein in ND3 intron [Golovinomyces cichoracearum]